MGDSRPTHQHADKDGQFRRKDSAFRDAISTDPGAKFPPEKDRYALYVNYGCPWAHRTIITRGLKSLEPYVQLILTDFDLTENGWTFTGRNGSLGADPLYGFTGLKQLYLKADPEYTGRYTVPCLWDKKTETIVNNESSEIIRMFYTCFDDFLDPPLRESSKLEAGLYPPHLRSEIDSMNSWVYNDINNGVYKCGFATTQQAFDDAIHPLFNSLDRIESHLQTASHGGPYLFGPHITEADIRLYTTMIRFDTAYHTIFQCNMKMIRHDYPAIHIWLRNLYWDTSDATNGGTFKSTSFFDVYKYGYLRAKGRQMHAGSDAGWTVVMPRGPVPDIMPLSEEEEKKLFGGVGGMEGLKVGNGDGTGEDGDGGKKLERQGTSHEKENEKWYKAAKKAEKKSGAPNMHLAL